MILICGFGIPGYLVYETECAAGAVLCPLRAKQIHRVRKGLCGIFFARKGDRTVPAALSVPYTR